MNVNKGYTKDIFHIEDWPAYGTAETEPVGLQKSEVK